MSIVGAHASALATCVIGIEILSPRRKGVLLDGLPFRDDVARIMQAVPFRILEVAR